MKELEKKIDLKPWYVGFGALAAGFAVVIGGYLAFGGTLLELVASLFAAAAAAAALGVQMKRRLYPWLYCTLAGLVVGLFSCLQFYWGDRFEREFFVAMATLAFFLVLGFIIGMAAEFVRLIHFITHGGDIRVYPRRPAAPAASRSRDLS